MSSSPAGADLAEISDASAALNSAPSEIDPTNRTGAVSENPQMSAAVRSLHPPILTRCGQEDIRKFVSARRRYEAEIESVSGTAIDLKLSIDPELLESLILLGELTDPVSDASIASWLSSKSDSACNPSSSVQLMSLLSKIELDYSETDPAQRMTKLSAEFVTTLRRAGFANFLNENVKKAIELFCDLLPMALKKKLTEDMEFRPALCVSFAHFYKHAVEQSVAFEAFRNAKRNDGPTSRSERKSLHGIRKKTMKPRLDVKSKDKKSVRLPDCLNKRCNGKHLVNDCPITSPEEKERLKAEYRRNKQASASSAKPKVARIQSFASSPAFTGKLNDTIDVKVVADSGADVSVIPSACIASLRDLGVYVPTMLLPVARNFKLAVDGVSCKSSEKVRLDITLDLQAGPLRLRGVEWFVVDASMPEILLGKPILESLGINVNSQIEALVPANSIIECSDVAERSQDTTSLSRLVSVLEDSLGDDEDPLGTGFYHNSAVELDTVAASSHTGTSVHDIDVHCSDTRAALDELLSQACSQGLSSEGESKLRALVCEFSDVFGLELDSGQPAKCPPMTVTLEPGTTPLRCRARSYSPAQHAFLRTRVDALERKGFLRLNTKSRWSSPPLIVPKPGPEGFRMTVDFRGVNAKTQPVMWPLPNLEVCLRSLGGSSVYAQLDFLQGYWQMALDPSCQEIYSIITPFGVYTPTRVLQGMVDAVAHFQSSVHALFGNVPRILQYLDDLLLYASSEDDLLTTLRAAFSICRDSNLKLHARKCVLFVREVNWCGRHISADGIRLDSRRISGLSSMDVPRTGADLVQFLCGCNWLRTNIPDYAAKVSPLHHLVEQVYSQAGSRRKATLRRLDLHASPSLWGPRHTECFQNIQNAIQERIRLAHPDSTQRVCVFTDASEFHWSSATTQVPPADLSLPVEQQRHSPLAFISGPFTGAALRWSIVEKEAYAVVTTFHRLSDLVMRPDGVSLFTDHSNLRFVFNPRKVNPTVSRHTAGKLMRWALQLSSYRYVVEHIPGEANVWADLMTRWGAPRISSARSTSLMRLAIPAPVATEGDFVFPTAAQIAAEQAKSDCRPADLRETDGFLITETGQVWIPDSAVGLQLRLCVIAHSGRGGHRGVQPTTTTLERQFYWPTLRKDVQKFVASCIHCVATTGGQKVPRPLGRAMHAERPNEVIHFDFLYIGRSRGTAKYVLIVKDDFSGYVWLRAHERADSHAVVETLSSWFSAFGVVRTWVSDQGSHFKNQVVEQLRRELCVQHHFTHAYCPWANGTVEVVCRETLRSLRALLSEMKLSTLEWPLVLPVAQTALNSASSTRLNGLSPLQVFTGLAPDTPLLAVLDREESRIVGSVEQVRAEQLVRTKKMMDSLEKMHRDVGHSRAASLNAAQLKHMKKTGVRPINFHPGDFVLAARCTEKRSSKLSLHWLGPYRVVSEPSKNVFQVQDLRTMDLSEVHASRLKFYCDAELSADVDLLRSHAEYASSGDAIYEISSFTDLRRTSTTDGFEVLCQWRGFDESEATWEPLMTMFEDVPDEVIKFLTSIPSHTLAAEALASLPGDH